MLTQVAFTWHVMSCISHSLMSGIDKHKFKVARIFKAGHTLTENPVFLLREFIATSTGTVVRALQVRAIVTVIKIHCTFINVYVHG